MRDGYVCLNGKTLPTSGRLRDDGMYADYSTVADCRDCPLKTKCCPNSPNRKIARHQHEAARDVARGIAQNLRRLAKLTVHPPDSAARCIASRCVGCVRRGADAPPPPMPGRRPETASPIFKKISPG